MPPDDAVHPAGREGSALPELPGGRESVGGPLSVSGGHRSVEGDLPGLLMAEGDYVADGWRRFLNS